MLNRNNMTTFTPTHDVVAEATAAGFFPPRHNVEITQVAELTDRVMRLTFRDPFIVSHAKPAQFVNLFTHDDFMLMPRPFGVSEVNGDEVSVIFAVVGHGTEQLAQLQAGDTVDVLGPLGQLHPRRRRSWRTTTDLRRAEALRARRLLRHRRLRLSQ